MGAASVKVAAAVAVGLVMAGGVHGHHHDRLGSLLSFGATPVGSTSSGASERLGMRMARADGFGAAQRRCLNELWTHESGWRLAAQNPSSPAFGIPQADPGSKMASAGPDWQTSAKTQIRWGLDYIVGRYNTPCNAWSFEMSHTPNWY